MVNSTQITQLKLRTNSKSGYTQLNHIVRGCLKSNIIDCISMSEKN